MSARLLMIGLDGADGRTLDRASLDGTLPNLTALRARGRGWALSSPLGATDDALWASFQYGTDVGEHGRFSYLLPTGAGAPDFAVRRELHRETFWDRLSQQDLRVAVFDVPKCRPPRQLNGIHLTDWLVHGRYDDVPLSYPRTLAGEIVERFGQAPPSQCAYQPPALSDDGVRQAHANMRLSLRQKRDAGLHYLTREKWDLFMIGFKEAHCACHMFWEFADATHAKYDAARVARLGNPVLDILKAQDAAIGDLVAAAGADADVLVFSTTDFVPNGTILHLMPQIIACLNRAIADRGNERLRRALHRLFRRQDPPPACEQLFSNDNGVGIRVHYRRSDTARQYARRLDLITNLVRELVDGHDSQPVISAVTRPSCEHPGARARSLPDLLLHFRTNICPCAVCSPRLGRIDATPPANIRTGNHHAGGFVFAAGPAQNDAAASLKSLEDFAALATRILGTTILDATVAGGKASGAGERQIATDAERASQHTEPLG